MPHDPQAPIILPFKPKEKEKAETISPGTKGFMACTCPNNDCGWGPLLNIGEDGIPFIVALVCIGCGRAVEIENGKLPAPNKIIRIDKEGNDNGERS